MQAAVWFANTRRFKFLRDGYQKKPLTGFHSIGCILFWSFEKLFFNLVYNLVLGSLTSFRSQGANRKLTWPWSWARRALAEPSGHEIPSAHPPLQLHLQHKPPRLSPQICLRRWLCSIPFHLERPLVLKNVLPLHFIIFITSFLKHGIREWAPRLLPFAYLHVLRQVTNILNSKMKVIVSSLGAPRRSSDTDMLERPQMPPKCKWWRCLPPLLPPTFPSFLPVRLLVKKSPWWKI